MAGVDDLGEWRRRTDQEARDVLDRSLRRRKPHPLRAPACQGIEPGERQREVAAALVACHGMDLVHDHRAHRAQHLARPLRGEDQIEGLGRRDENVRRPLDHTLSFGGGRVSRADERADLDVGELCRA